MADILDSGPGPRPRPARRRWTTLLAGVLVAATAAVLAVRSGPGRPDRPAPTVGPSVVAVPAPTPWPTGPPAPEAVYRVSGDPGRGPAGLRLLVGGGRPGVLDAGEGVLRPLPGLRVPAGAVVDLDRRGGTTVALIRGMDGPSRGLALPDPGGSAGLGAVDDVLPMRDGTVLTVGCATPGVDCVLTSRAATGTVRWRRPVPSGFDLLRDTPYGLLVQIFPPDTDTDTDFSPLIQLQDARSGRVSRTVGLADQVLGVDDRHVVLQPVPCDGGCPLSLVDLSDGTRSVLPRPSGSPGFAVFSPDGHRIAVGCYGLHSQDPNPQVVREGFVAVLDLDRRTWTRMPGLTTGAKTMPLPAWTPDGTRLVVASGNDGVGTLVTWQPGAARLTVLPVRLRDFDSQPGMFVVA